MAIEARMFTQIEPYLTDDQLLRLERVRRQRARIRSRAAGSEFPAGKLDLGWVIGDLTDAGIDCTPHDPEAFDAILWAYDLAMTPLCEQRYDKAMRIFQHGVPLRVESMVLAAAANGEEESRERAGALMEEYYHGNREYALVARRIHDLNRRYLDLFADQLPDEAAEALVTRFRERAYPAIFPDPYDFADVLEKAAEIETGLVTARNASGKPILYTPVDLPLEVTVKFFETSRAGVFRFPSMMKDDHDRNLIHYNSDTIKATPGQTDLKSLLDSLTR